MDLWEQARDLFSQRLQDQNENSAAIEKFLSDKASLLDARHIVEQLRTDSDLKYGVNGSRGKISAKWTSRILDNLDKFIVYGNEAMKAAPESVGIVWFAVKQVLGAISNDYKLYGIFYAALNDITEMMVLIQTYDKIYHDHSTFDQGTIYRELSTAIVEVYTSILEFSFSVCKHLTGSKLAKLKHAFKDIVGILNQEFEGKIKSIHAQKVLVIGHSAAAFQQKTTDKLESVSTDLSTIHKTMYEAFKSLENDSTEWRNIVNQARKDSMRSHRELAAADHQKYMKLLHPYLDQSISAIHTHLQDREEGTCAWIEHVQMYCEWRDSIHSKILCLTGETGSGKSVMGAYVHETLQKANGQHDQYVVQYVSPPDRTGHDDPELLKRILNTIIRELYKYSLSNNGDEFLIQRCNGVFARQSSSNREQFVDRHVLPESPSHGVLHHSGINLYSGLIKIIAKPVFLIVDAIDGLSDADQKVFAEFVQSFVSDANICLRILLLYRPSSPISRMMRDQNVSRLKISEHNTSDISLLINKRLKTIPGLSKAERDEIHETISHKARHRISYIKQVVIPFLHHPLQRPVSSWLQNLPANISDAYHQHLRQLDPQYYSLFRKALGWVVVARVPLTVEEIMEAYSELYLHGDVVQEKDWTKPDSALYREQIHKAGGPFLEILDNQTVVLADVEAVRQFCASESFPLSGISNQHDSCHKCRTTVHPGKPLQVFEKDEHLNLALICMKNLNSKTFQMRFWSHLMDDAAERVKLSKSRIKSKNKHARNFEGALNRTLPPETKQVSQKRFTVDFKVQLNGVATVQDLSLSRDDVSIEQDDDISIFSDRHDGDDFVNITEEEVIIVSNQDSSRRRYESTSWMFHLREADHTLTKDEKQTNEEWQELVKECQRFWMSNPVAFEAWKAYDGWDLEVNWTPLHMACWMDCSFSAKLLLNRGANVMDDGLGHGTPLHLASLYAQNGELVPLLLAYGADPNFTTAETSTPLCHLLSTCQDIQPIIAMLRYGAQLTARDEHGSTPLHYFARWGKGGSDILRLLLRNPLNPRNCADINAEENTGTTPLHKLLRRDEIPLELLEAFLQNGADVNKIDKSSGTPLYEASSWGDAAVVKLLLGYSKEVDFKNKHGKTALHAASYGGHLKTVEILVSHHADVSSKDKHDRTPLFHACLSPRNEWQRRSNMEATAEFLLEQQIGRGSVFNDISGCTNEGRTVLREASGRGFTKVVTRLLEQMSIEDMKWINYRDKRRGRTALHSAAAHGRTDVIRILLQYCADITIRDGANGEGKTALELCIDGWAFTGLPRFEDAVCLLVNACGEEAKQNRVILTAAATFGSVVVLEKMMELGVELDAPDPFGWTPSDIASQFGHIEFVSRIAQSLLARRLRPTIWQTDGISQQIIIQENGRHVSYEGDMTIALTSDHPIPARAAVYYFEIEILKPEIDGGRGSSNGMENTTAEFGIGFCTSIGKFIEFPGWPPLSNARNVQSWAYHGHNGGLYATDKKKWPVRRGSKSGLGDVVGCGLEVAAKRIFFTMNGKRAANQTFEDVKGRMFPVLGLKGKVKLRTNFGTDPKVPFLWNPDVRKPVDTQEKAATVQTSDSPVKKEVRADVQSKAQCRRSVRWASI